MTGETPAQAIEVLESAPAPGRRIAVVALAVVAAGGAALLASSVLTRGDEPRRRYVSIDESSGRQMSAFGDGEYGYVGTVDVLEHDVAFVSVAPLDADGREVPHVRAGVERDPVVAQRILYGQVDPQRDPVTATPGDRLSLVLRVRPDCTRASPVTAVRLVLTVGGRSAEQVVALPAAHGAAHASATRTACRGA